MGDDRTVRRLSALARSASTGRSVRFGPWRPSGVAGFLPDGAANVSASELMGVVLDFEDSMAFGSEDMDHARLA